MAKYHQIIHELMKLSIPNGVRQIIAEYAFVSNQAKMIALLKNHNGCIRLFEEDEPPRGGSKLFAYSWNNNSIVLAPGGHRYGRRIPVENLVLILNSQFWNKCHLGNRMKRLAPLWQILYEEWMATVV